MSTTRLQKNICPCKPWQIWLKLVSFTVIPISRASSCLAHAQTGMQQKGRGKVSRWMKATVRSRVQNELASRNPCDELKEYLHSYLEPECADVVRWWGVSASVLVVLHHTNQCTVSSRPLSNPFVHRPWLPSHSRLIHHFWTPLFPGWLDWDRLLSFVPTTFEHCDFWSLPTGMGSLPWLRRLKSMLRTYGMMMKPLSYRMFLSRILIKPI